MDKKEIYEHLAKIYLDASSKKTKKSKFRRSFFKNPFFISIAVIFTAALLLFLAINRNNSEFSSSNPKRPIKTELAFVFRPDIVKINFNFESAKAEIYSISLDKINLARFKAVAFSVRKAHYENKVTLKVELANMVNERSEIMIAEIPSYKWRDCRINLAEFKDISDWSEMTKLSFIVEDGFTDKKNGIVYIDNVRLVR